MTHYVLADHYTGYIWGEADAADPVEACRIVDKKIDPGIEREYEESRLDRSTASGYHVFAAPEIWTPVEDGQSEDEIERVQRECRKVTEVATRVVSY